MDSLGSVLKMGRLYFESTEDATPFDNEWLQAVQVILETLRIQQAPLDPTNFTKAAYTFQTQASRMVSFMSIIAANTYGV